MGTCTHTYSTDSAKSFNCFVTSSHCFCLCFFFFLFFQAPSSALPLTHIYVYCSASVRHMRLLFRVSLLYPAVNPLPSETLPFPFPDILTHMHTPTPANAHNIQQRSHTHTHTPCRPEPLFQTSYTFKHGCFRV